MGLGSVCEEQDIWSRMIDYVDPVQALVPCDDALIFGTRHGVDHFVRKIMEGYREGAFRRAIISGGVTMGETQPEALVLADKLDAEGLPSGNILIEDRATNTLENVLYSRELLTSKGEGPDRLLLIGKICSMRRYMMTVAKQWPEIRIMSKLAVNYFETSREAWHSDEVFRKRVLGEFERIARYRDKGDIAEVAAMKG